MQPKVLIKIGKKMDKKQTIISMLESAKALVTAGEMKAALPCVRSIVELLKSMSDGE